MSDGNNYIGNCDPDDVPDPSTDEADEAALDALMLRFGADYNRPSDFVPREEMWHEIRRSIGQQPSVRRHQVIAVLAAAVVLLAAGIGIGVEAHSRIVSGAIPVGQAHDVNPRTSDAVVSATPLSTSSTDIETAPNDVRPRQSPGMAPRQATSGSYGNRGVAAASNNDARSTAYSLATVRHFTAVEALLTSYQTSQHDARGDAQMAAWARALLSQTRLLLDSPAAKDPARNKLLQDLELILVQMTQLSPTDTPIDREIIDGSVTHTDVITRLRTAVPAGAATTL